MPRPVFMPRLPGAARPALPGLLLAALLLAGPADAAVEWSVGIQVPGVSIGISVPGYPQLQRVPGYPVYYAPSLQANFFFYDGVYWVFQNDEWYASTWYDGPWARTAPEAVPLFVLRVPVRYYRRPPGYFRGWQREAPPRWGEHWGAGWQSQHRGWDRWDRRSAPPPAPLPEYQRRYPAGRYPQPEQQPELRDRNYRYMPRDEAARPHYEAPRRGQQGPDRAGPPGREPQGRRPEQDRDRDRSKGDDRGDDRHR